MLSSVPNPKVTIGVSQLSEIAIKVEGLGKRYRIGANQEAYRTLREKLNETALAPFRAAKHLLTRNGNGAGQRAKGKEQSGDNGSSPVALCPLRSRASRDNTFWALKNISFEIKAGEVVGIIGRNGAGKSTLLKILSRITEPTEGYADIHGRIASLLEVGTGFHPELTGRENIYLNGSILGMKRAEIKRKFDEMVAFAEIDKFIDTPVKHYSSGMYVRLAFAVAAHLDPEILLVDEVLAVGDAAFQKKCLGKMGDVAKQGRTVLFVSHNMQSIAALCEECILLSGGTIKAKGPAQRVIQGYLEEATFEAARTVDFSSPNIRRDGTGSSRFIQLELIGNAGVPTSSFEVGERFEISFKCEVHKLIPSQFYQIHIRALGGTPIYHWVDFDDSFSAAGKPGLDSVSVKLDQLRLYPGKYVVSLMVCDRYGTAYDFIEDAAIFDVTAGSLVPLARQFFPHLGLIHEVPKWERSQQ
jgi:homopolymeric O-antigen transport system ATP-binding protein